MAYYGLSSFGTGAALQKKRASNAQPGALPMPAMPSLSRSQPVTPITTASAPKPLGSINKNVGPEAKAGWSASYSPADLMAGRNADLTGMTPIESRLGVEGGAGPGGGTGGMVRFTQPVQYDTTINGYNMSPVGAAGLQMASAERARLSNEDILAQAMKQVNAPGGESEQYPETYWDLRRRQRAADVKTHYQAALDSIDQEVRNGASGLWARTEKGKIASKMRRDTLNAIADENNKRFDQTETAKMDRARLLAGLGAQRPYQETSYTKIADWLHGMGMEDTQMQMALDAASRAQGALGGVGFTGGMGGGGGTSPVSVPAVQTWNGINYDTSTGPIPQRKKPSHAR